MALTDQVIMPGSDYQAICDATRNLTGKTGVLKSGDISTELGTIGIVEQATPSLSVNAATGLVTAEATQAAGLVAAGTKKATKQLVTQAAKTVTPTEAEQIAVASGKYTTGDVVVAAVPTTYVGSGIGRKSSSDLTANGAIVTVPAGYYENTANKNVERAIQATPNITVNSSGLITASATQSAGYVSVGTKTATKQLTTQSAKTVTPSNSSQTAVSSGVYTTGAVTVAAVPTETKTVTPVWVEDSSINYISPSNGKFLTEVALKKPSTLIPSNIKKGVSIGGVVGAIPEITANVLLDKVSADSESLNVTGDTATLNVHIFLDPNDKAVEGNMILPEPGTATKPVTVPTEIIVIDPEWHENSSYISYPANIERLIRKVQVYKPVGLIPSNIKKGAYVGGIVGTFEGGGGVDLPFTKLTTVSTNNGILSFSFTGYYDTIIAKRSGTNKILTAVFGNNLKASFGIESEGSVLSTSAGFSYNQVGSNCRVTWNICDSSGSAWYEGSYEIYGCNNG